jgi:hypothetical protein
LDALRAFVGELKTDDKSDTAINESSEDKPFLCEKLLAVKSACGEYDENAAEGVLKEIRAKQWSQRTWGLLSKISECLLHSDFDEVEVLVDGFIK